MFVLIFENRFSFLRLFGLFLRFLFIFFGDVIIEKQLYSTYIITVPLIASFTILFGLERNASSPESYNSEKNLDFPFEGRFIPYSYTFISLVFSLLLFFVMILFNNLIPSKTSFSFLFLCYFLPFELYFTEKIKGALINSDIREYNLYLLLKAIFSPFILVVFHSFNLHQNFILVINLTLLVFLIFKLQLFEKKMCLNLIKKYIKLFLENIYFLISTFLGKVSLYLFRISFTFYSFNVANNFIIKLLALSLSLDIVIDMLFWQKNYSKIIFSIEDFKLIVRSFNKYLFILVPLFVLIISLSLTYIYDISISFILYSIICFTVMNISIDVFVGVLGIRNKRYHVSQFLVFLFSAFLLMSSFLFTEKNIFLFILSVGLIVKFIHINNSYKNEDYC